MSIQEYRDIAFGWAILLVFLSLFWYVLLRRLGAVMKQYLASTSSRQTVPESVPGAFLFLVRGEFSQSGDPKLAGVCKRLRRLLYGYLGAFIGYIVFLILFRPH